jgi:response regulator RpfG family c-di-GMP phosphodiesterase
MTADPRKRPRVLCVDDEPNVLQGLSLHLGRRYELATATSGQAALELLAHDATAVVISDMRMPGMDGAAFLARAKQVSPDAVRMLLTGQADIESAIAAVNEGQIFRFLTKPCPPPALLAAVEAAAEMHRLIHAERELLEHTLHGSIKALTDVLALTNPASFGRATRIKRHVTDMAMALEMGERWQVEVAAMLSQLGFITLPAETAEKVYFGRPLSLTEQQMVGKVPAVTEQLLGSIPRLEVVREILATYAKPYKPVPPTAAPDQQLAGRGAQLLRVALDFDTLEAQGATAALAVDTLRGRSQQYDPEVIGALARVRASEAEHHDVREVRLSALRVGMVFAEDVTFTSGALLAARGYAVTPSFVERAGNFQPGMVHEPLRVIVSRESR